MAKAAENSIEGRALPYVERVERLKAEMKSLQGKYMQECASLRDDIKEIFLEVKNNGLPVRAVKGIIKYRDLERRQAEISAGLDMDEAATFEALVEALGPLDRAAADRAGVKVAEEPDVRPRHLRERDASRADGDALAKVGKGAAVDSITEPAATH